MRSLFLVLLMVSVCRAAEPADCAAEHKRAVALRNTLASVGETSADYRNLMLKKIQEAEAAAAACDRAVVADKRAAAEREAAKKRDEEVAEKKRAADQFAVDELRSQASFLRLAWSAHECMLEQRRNTLSANPFASDEQKENLRQSEVLLERVRGLMKRGKIQALACRADAVAKLAFCIADGHAHPACAQVDMARMAAAEAEIIATAQLVPSEAPLTPGEKHEQKGELEDLKLLAPRF